MKRIKLIQANDLLSIALDEMYDYIKLRCSGKLNTVIDIDNYLCKKDGVLDKIKEAKSIMRNELF